jgi:hypothetical protein
MIMLMLKLKLVLVLKFVFMLGLMLGLMLVLVLGLMPPLGLRGSYSFLLIFSEILAEVRTYGIGLAFAPSL